jgi:hypothetical protein
MRVGSIYSQVWMTSADILDVHQEAVRGFGEERRDFR